MVVGSRSPEERVWLVAEPSPLKPEVHLDHPRLAVAAIGSVLDPDREVDPGVAVQISGAQLAAHLLFPGVARPDSVGAGR